jgi:tRNA(Arg) A34 adenosine deaminase TadA
MGMNHSELEHLRLAISIAEQARAHGNHPFGAVLCDQNGQVLLTAENSVTTGRDCTGHAELNLVRKASQSLSAAELAMCTLYSSTEPCAMCSGAIHWAGIGRVVYALSEFALYEIVGPSPENLYLPCRAVFGHTGRPVEILGPSAALDVEARAVHAGFWR